jgi:hypothetical protein
MVMEREDDIKKIVVNVNLRLHHVYQAERWMENI